MHDLRPLRVFHKKKLSLEELPYRGSFRGLGVKVLRVLQGFRVWGSTRVEGD